MASSFIGRRGQGLVFNLLLLVAVIGTSGCIWRFSLIEIGGTVSAKDIKTGSHASTEKVGGTPSELLARGSSTGWSESSRKAMLFRPSDGAMPKASEIPQGNSKCPPNYLILGTRKGGTTSLHRYISASHPDIFPYKIPHGSNGPNVRKKGTGGLNHDKSRGDLGGGGEAHGKVGSDEYSKKFQMIPNGKIFGDGTVSRIIDEAPQLAEFCQDSKFFVLLRDPVSRCHSQYLMHMRHHPNEISDLSPIIAEHVQAFENFVDRYANLAYDEFPNSFMNSASNCLYEGAYVLHLRRLLGSGVDPSRLRIYFTDDLRENTELVVTDALHHIGLSSEHIDSELLRQQFNIDTSRGHRPAHLELQPSLIEHMKNDMVPYDRELIKFLGVASLPWRPEWD